MTLPSAAVLAELVRLPAVLTVPGDAWLGAAAGGAPRRSAALPAASALIYLGGMALNDWADRAQDADERPERPIPSGRISESAALAVGAGLVAAGVGVAGSIGGWPALAVAGPLAAAVLAYDTAAKDTVAGPAVMAACRGLDVLLGASGGSPLQALPAAAVVAAHTATVTAVSRHEVHGAPPTVPVAATAATALVALASARMGGARSRTARVLSAAAAAAYAARVGGGYVRAVQADGDAIAIRQAVGGGVMGLIPLQAGLLAGAGALVRAAAVAAAIPLGQALRRRREVT